MPIRIKMIIKIGRVFPSGGKTGRFIWNWGPSPVTGPKCQLMNNSGEGGGVYRGDRPPARKKTCRWKKESETQNSNNREIFFRCKNWHIVCKEGLGATWICISFFVRAGDLALIHIIYSQKSSLLTLFTPTGGTLCPPPCHIFAYNQRISVLKKLDFSQLWVWKRAVRLLPHKVISFRRKQIEFIKNTNTS